MRLHIQYIFLILILMLSTACAPKIVTKGEAFPQMYAEKPLSVLVLPPINSTTAADAKPYYSTTIAEPFSFSGFYIYPIEVTTDILRYEGFPDAELLIDVPPQKFKEFFGADAVLFTNIVKWDTSYIVVGGSVTVGLEFNLKSTDTGETLWTYRGEIKEDTSADTGNLIANLIVTALKTALTDYVPIAKRVNYKVLNTIPLGPYHQNHGKDGSAMVVEAKKIAENGR